MQVNTHRCAALLMNLMKWIEVHKSLYCTKLAHHSSAIKLFMVTIGNGQEEHHVNQVLLSLHIGKIIREAIRTSAQYQYSSGCAYLLVLNSSDSPLGAQLLLLQGHRVSLAPSSLLKKITVSPLLLSLLDEFPRSADPS